MSFIDEMEMQGKKIVKKAKGLAGIADLKARILEKEAAIDKLYKEIGENVYISFESSGNSSYLQLCQEIAAIRKEINEMQNEIVKLKDSKICQSCGAKLKEDAKFCSVCGCKIEKTPMQENDPILTVKICQKCGADADVNAQFCGECGNKFEDSADGPTVIDVDFSNIEKGNTES